MAEIIKESEMIKIGIADYNYTKSPNILTTLGLGSCLGITFYDPINKVGGLVHIMLPSSEQIRNNTNKAKFADTGIECLLQDMLKEGVKRSSLKCKIAGGAQMFSFYGKGNNVLKIGERNVIEAKKVLKELDIPIVAEDTGGNYGRTIELDCDTGMLMIKSIGHGIKQI